MQSEDTLNIVHNAFFSKRHCMRPSFFSRLEDRPHPTAPFFPMGMQYTDRRSKHGRMSIMAAGVHDTGA